MRHRAGSVITFVMMIGCMIGSGVPAAVGPVLSETAMGNWGWCLPFLIGFLVALTNLVLRIGLEETIGDVTDEPRGSPLLAAVRGHW